MTTALVSRLAAPSLLVDDVLTAVRRGCRSDTIVIMAELLAVDVFAALELGALADIARRSVHLTFYAGDQICRVGERSDSMFVLVRGKTEAWVRGDGDRMVLGRANDGAVFGELGVITGRPRSASIEVASATATVIAIPGDALDELLGRDLHAARGIPYRCLRLSPRYALHREPRVGRAPQGSPRKQHSGLAHAGPADGEVARCRRASPDDVPSSRRRRRQDDGTRDGAIRRTAWLSRLVPFYPPPASLAHTEAERSALWKRYVGGEFHVGIDQVAASLDTVLGSVGVGERRDVEHDLLHFCRELLRAARGAAGALHRDTQAEAEFEALLDLILRPSARTAPTEIEVDLREKLATSARCSSATSAPKCSGVAARYSFNASR